MNILVISPNNYGDLLPRLKPHNYWFVSEITDDFFEKIENFSLDIVIDLNPYSQTMITNLIYNDYKPKLVICNILSHTATEYKQQSGLDCNVYGVSFIDVFFHDGKFIETCKAHSNKDSFLKTKLSEVPLTEKNEFELIADLFGKELKILEDSIGLVSARVLAMVINEAFFATQEQVASIVDIDTAMKLGTNYPLGPIEWANKITPEILLTILDSLHDHYKEERYKAASSLRLLANS